MPEITGGQSVLLGGRAFPKFAFLRELKGNCVLFLVLGRFLGVSVFPGRLTGGQIALLGDRACPDVENLRELGENCVSFWQGFVLGLFCDFRAFFAFWRKIDFTGDCA